MKTLNNIYAVFLSEKTKKQIEKATLYVALIGFFIHLVLIFLSKLNIIGLGESSDLFQNPISAIYTPFSFIIIYEVYLLIYYLPKSFTTYITKQYEIITLIIIRKLFKDLSVIELSSNWFEIKDDLQFTFDIIASVVLFYLIYQFQRLGKRKPNPQSKPVPKIEQFIQRKRLIAVFLVPTFLIMAVVTFVTWVSDISLVTSQIPSFESINSLFFEDFFTVLILVDVVLLLISFFYTDQFHKIIRNSGFVVSTILIRISFGVSGSISTVLITTAVIFGLLIILIHNKYEQSNTTEIKPPKA